MLLHLLCTGCFAIIPQKFTICACRTLGVQESWCIWCCKCCHIFFISLQVCSWIVLALSYYVCLHLLFKCSNIYSIFLHGSSRWRMSSFHGIMHIDFLFKMQKDQKLRVLNHLFLLIIILFKNLQMCLTSGSTLLLKVLSTLSTKRWKHIDCTRFVCLP